MLFLYLALFCAGCAWMVPENLGQAMAGVVVSWGLETLEVIGPVAQYHAQNAAWPRTFEEAVGASVFKKEDLAGITVTVVSSDASGCVLSVHRAGEEPGIQGIPQDYLIKVSKVETEDKKYRGEYLPSSDSKSVPTGTVTLDLNAGRLTKK